MKLLIDISILIVLSVMIVLLYFQMRGRRNIDKRIIEDLIKENDKLKRECKNCTRKAGFLEEHEIEKAGKKLRKKLTKAEGR